MPFQKKSLRSSTEKNLRKWSFSSFAKRRKKHRPKRNIPWLKIFLILFSLGVITAVIGVFIISRIVLKDLPPIDEKSLIFSESTVLYDSTGENKLYTVHGDLNRKIVSIDEMSPHIVSAMLAAEDDQFFSHSGFDIGGIVKAVCHEIIGNFGGFCPPRGGSTITQQMIKNFFLTSDRTMTRKAREIVLAYKIEQKYPKEKILEIYLNGISFGSNLGGVEIASNAFFDVSAQDITPAQAAVLASMPQAPTRYSPFGKNVRSHLLISDEVITANKIRTLEDLNSYDENSWRLGLIGQEVELYDGTTVYLTGRSDWVLTRMNQLGYISDEQVEEGKQELKEMTFERYRAEITAPHFVMWVRDILEEKFGTDLVEHGGLKVVTTIDIEMQEKAEEAIEGRREKNVEVYGANNAALVAIHPQTGDVKAMVGSADYWDDEIDGKVNVLLNKRLPGSSFKPIAYAASFVHSKLTPATVLFDVETDFGSDWVPKNYNGLFSGPVTIRYALGQSLNIPAVKATIIAGPEKVYELAKKMGISFDFDSDFYGAAIALGGAEARPLDMAVAFSTFANGGKGIAPNALLRVEDRYGNILFSTEEDINLEMEEDGDLVEAETEEAEDNQVLDAGVAYLIADMLSDSSARGAGWNDRLQLTGRKNLVKTGTADKKVNNKAHPADCWTIGGVPQLMTAVWTGNTKGEVLSTSASGYALASPIWNIFMESALENAEAEDFEIPAGVRRIQVSKLTGFLPPEGMPESLISEDLVASINTPWKEDESLSYVEIDSVSRKLPTEYTPKESIIRVPVLKMNSYFPQWGAWENPVQDWLTSSASSYIERLGVGSDVLFAAPTEYDDVHTPVTLESAPTVEIVSGNIVSSPKTTILIDASAENGFEKIIFSWNGRLIKSFTTHQKAYIIPVPPSATGTNNITVEVFDKYSLSGTDSINVTLGKDITGPELTILSPKNNGALSTGAFISFSARAIDDEGAVQKVAFYIDGKVVGTDVRLYDEASASNYEYIWQSPNTEGEHTLKVMAVDVSGNKTIKELSFTLSKRTVDSLFAVFSPKNGSTYTCSASLPISIGISSDMKESFDHLEIIAEDSSRRQQVISSFIKIPSSGFFDTTFVPGECGDWKVFARVYLENGNRRTSGKATVTLED